MTYIHTVNTVVICIVLIYMWRDNACLIRQMILINDLNETFCHIDKLMIFISFKNRWSREKNKEEDAGFF